MSRQQILTTFNSRFYVWMLNAETNNLFESPVCSDVHEGIAKALEYFALHDIEHPRRVSINHVYLVSLTESGPYATMPIGPAWRLCSPVVQGIVEQTLIQTVGDWVTNMLMEGDVQDFVESMERAGIE